MTETEDSTPKIKFSKKMLARETVKFAARSGVKLVIGTAIAQIVPTETKAQKARVAVGTYVLSSMVADQANTWAHREFDEFCDTAETLLNKIKSEKPKSDSATPTE